VGVADETTPLGQAYKAYEQLEGRLSTALDQLVGSNGFADLLASSATNVMALTRVANGTVDQAVRATRLAVRKDVTDLARQLARTEDKLERLLQAVEALQARLDEVAPSVAPRGEVSSATTPGTRKTTSAPAAAKAASAPAAEKAAAANGSAANGTAAKPRARAAVRRGPQ
jgi:BMFP domain-containing protein YqiC